MRFFILFALLLLASFVLGPAFAAPEDYTVSGVAIDQPTTDPTLARDEALDTALKKAYEEFRTRRAAAGETLPPVASAPLWKMMQDFEVADERISATRYIGTFTIRFRPNATADAVAAGEAAALAAAGPMAAQPAVFRFANLMEWQAARTAIKNTAGVHRTAVTGLRRGQVDFNLSYTGQPDAVVNALIAQGFSVTAAPENNSIWLLAYRR